MDIIRRAAKMYKGRGENPLKLYDLDIARALLREKLGS
jgi:hypothetical protein